MAEAFAVLETGGKQFKVANGSVIVVPKLVGNPGDEVKLDRVLALNQGGNTKIGSPYVSGAAVVAKIVTQFKGPKVISYKKNKRKGFHKKIGSRAALTRLKVETVTA